ncbi:unnamed protein product, partial [Phaeothamnion confervicola]
QAFGVPYIVAPMEAEAQCAELERLGLVDGVVTDDSDVWVFGGRVVYKNIFDDKKYVEAYYLTDAEREIGLGTDEMRALALLLGSDYTEGVRGVGIVNAMEILRAFSCEGHGPAHSLERFREWLDGFDFEVEKPKRRRRGEPLPVLSEVHQFHVRHCAARHRWVAPPGFPAAEV